MNEIIDIYPDINVREEEYIRLLGYPAGYKLNERSRELADWARQWFNENGKPWVYAVMTDQLDYSGRTLKINEVEFASKRFRDQLAEASACSAMLVAVSAGKELEEKSRRLWHEGKPDEYFFLEVYGSAVVEHLVTNTGARFCAWAEENNKAILPHYSPGYPGWNVTDQVHLLKIIKEKKLNDLPCGISVFETGMLNPKKSMLAVFGITENVKTVGKLNDFIPCESCSLRSCQFRRASYKYPLKQIENVQQLQPGNMIGIKSNEENNIQNNVLEKKSIYSVRLKALQKWSKEKLKINKLGDGTFEAKFLYEGTTCSNLGQTLEFEYNIKLSPAEENYKIISLSCCPAKGDKGYSFMCEYISNGESLMKSIKEEKPMLGKPLSDILKWVRNYNPESCYCKADGREHKWGLVFEVLHYTLVQYENGIISLPENEEIKIGMNNLLEYKL